MMNTIIAATSFGKVTNYAAKDKSIEAHKHHNVTAVTHNYLI